MSAPSEPTPIPESFPKTGQHAASPGRTALGRRDFLRFSGAAAAVWLAPRMTTMAGPFDIADFDKMVPADKKLSAAWIRSLTTRGERTVYRRSDLEKIGMPVGGIGTGQLYLGGDGRLWHWDIFNRVDGSGGQHYAKPMQPDYPVGQGFSLRVHSEGGGQQTRTLDAKGFPGVTFCGEYPIAQVGYQDEGCPVSVIMEAFSPFIPLNVADSSLPATVLRFALENTGNRKVEAEISGWLENPICLHTGTPGMVTRVNEIGRGAAMLSLSCRAHGTKTEASAQKERPVIVFADFEGATFAPWKVEGTAFGKGPSHGAPTREQHLQGFAGKALANSWALASDEPKGKLISPDFTIERDYINFLIGGGNHPHETCINLIADGKIVRTATGKDTDKMEPMSWNVGDLSGKRAHIEIVDNASASWGHIDIDQIEFSDRPATPTLDPETSPDFGTMVLALLHPGADDHGTANTSGAQDAAFAGGENTPRAEMSDGKPIGAISRKLTLQPGERQVVTYVLTWNFPNLNDKKLPATGRHYATRFPTADAVAAYVADNAERLIGQTKLWHDTWYDSTLPHWFLDRTFANASILATSTCYRFANGRFYGWEGVGCCAGTCTHVWQYEQAMGRLFPELDILLREMAEFKEGVGFRADGMIDHRGEFHAGFAIDGQAGTILRAYRDHQVSPDGAFLKRNWPAIKKATEWLISQPGGENGILTAGQHNTLDAQWYGPVSWLSGLYLASLRATEQLALELGDSAMAARCGQIAEKGSKAMVAGLFNGEYFINKPDPKRPDAINSGSGCEIDQVFGQGWAFQVGLPRILPEKETRSALRSLWRYNFSPDVGPYRKINKPGRWYAMAGEAGLLMCTFPKSDWNYAKAKGKGPEWAAGYFNECMNGFEHQVAGHMIWEGMLQEGLAVERAVHDRYHASRRNPWNEIECGDHYARSMASYGVFTAICGFEYHGPKGHIGFAPRLGPEQFKAAFTAAEGWGSYEQKREQGVLSAIIRPRWGRLRVRSLAFAVNAAAGAVAVTLDGKTLKSSHHLENGNLQITLAEDANVKTGSELQIRIG